MPGLKKKKNCNPVFGQSLDAYICGLFLKQVFFLQSLEKHSRDAW